VKLRLRGVSVCTRRVQTSLAGGHVCYCGLVDGPPVYKLTVSGNLNVKIIAFLLLKNVVAARRLETSDPNRGKISDRRPDITGHLACCNS